MATYRAIAASEVDPDSPLTATLASAWTDNVLAIGEGASGAPRISPSAQGLTAITGSASGTLTLTGFAPYEGTSVELKYVNTAAGTGTIQISLSDDGVAFSTPLVLVNYLGNSVGSAFLVVDFATGNVSAVESSPAVVTGSTPAASAAVTHVRFTFTGSGTVSQAALALPNAGTVA